MSRKLPFKVIHTSGSDENHPGSELEIHGPTSKGWQSARFCVYPQEIVLTLKETSKIVKLQILSHQYNIPSKIEIFIANPVVQGSTSLHGVKFKRLGYVPLSENESTNFKARELKSVHLNADGQFIKLLIHKNFVNKVNLFNQVSIIAVNIIGQSLAKEWDDNANYFCRTDELITSYMSKENGDSTLNNGPLTQARYEAGKYISPLDDLAFDMYQDPETAQLIRRLEDKKRQAVLDERYDYAKKLKQAMTDLYKVGEKLGKFEVDKRRAVELEDYELAKSKKLQSDEYRLYVYKQLNVFDLLELKQSSKYENTLKQRSPIVEASVVLSSFDTSNHKQPHVVVETSSNQQPTVASPSFRNTSPEEIKLPPVSTSIIATRESIVSVAPNNDERPLPALHGKSVVVPEEPVEVEPEKEDENAELHTLSEKEEREASIIIDIFGMIVTRKLFSKSWKFRQESITCLNEELENPSERSAENSPSRISRAVVAALKKGLNDQVYVVLQDSVDLLKKLLLTYVPNNGLSKTELSRTVEKLLPIVLKRTGDMVPRSRNMMFDTVVELANTNEVKELNIVPSIVTEPIKGKKQAPWRLMKSQIDMIKALIPDLGIDNKNGFDLDSVMKILTAGIQHANGMVRDASLECIMEIYKVIKEPLKRYFPPDDASSRKNPLYVKLFDGFDKVDGKLTAAERKAAAIKQKETHEKQQKEEVKALQAQLEQLRSMAQDKIAPGKSTAADDVADSKLSIDGEVAVSHEPVKRNTKETKAEKNVEKQTLSIDGGKSNESRKQVKVNTPRKDLANQVMERLCIFCGEQNDKFTDEQLDIHYWKSCPMLKRCQSCTEVVEIAEMNEHLIAECEQKDKFMKCKICGTVILITEENNHLQTEQCQQNGNEKRMKCPLCLIPVGDGDEKWKTHLIENCKVNSERLKKNEEKKPLPKKVVQKSRGGGRGGMQTPKPRGRGTSRIPHKTPVRKK